MLGVKKICRDCQHCQIQVKFGVLKGYKCKLTDEFIDLNYTCREFEFTDFLKKELLKHGEIII